MYVPMTHNPECEEEEGGHVTPPPRRDGRVGTEGRRGYLTTSTYLLIFSGLYGLAVTMPLWARDISSHPAGHPTSSTPPTGVMTGALADSDSDSDPARPDVLQAKALLGSSSSKTAKVFPLQAAVPAKPAANVTTLFSPATPRVASLTSPDVNLGTATSSLPAVPPVSLNVTASSLVEPATTNTSLLNSASLTTVTTTPPTHAEVSSAQGGEGPGVPEVAGAPPSALANVTSDPGGQRPGVPEVAGAPPSAHANVTSDPGDQRPGVPEVAGALPSALADVTSDPGGQRPGVPEVAGAPPSAHADVTSDPGGQRPGVPEVVGVPSLFANVSSDPGWPETDVPEVAAGPHPLLSTSTASETTRADRLPGEGVDDPQTDGDSVDTRWKYSLQYTGLTVRALALLLLTCGAAVCMYRVWCSRLHVAPAPTRPALCGVLAGVLGVYGEILLWLGVELLAPNPALLPSQLCCSVTALFCFFVGIVVYKLTVPRDTEDHGGCEEFSRSLEESIRRHTEVSADDRETPAAAAATAATALGTERTPSAPPAKGSSHRDPSPRHRTSPPHPSSPSQRLGNETELSDRASVQTKSSETATRKARSFSTPGYCEADREAVCLRDGAAELTACVEELAAFADGRDQREPMEDGRVWDCERGRLEKCGRGVSGRDRLVSSTAWIPHASGVKRRSASTPWQLGLHLEEPIHDVNEPRYNIDELRHKIDELRHNIDEHRHNVDETCHNVDEPRHNVDEPRHNVDEPRHNVDEPRHNVDDATDAPPNPALEVFPEGLDTRARVVSACPLTAGPDSDLSQTRSAYTRRPAAAVPDSDLSQTRSAYTRRPAAAAEEGCAVRARNTQRFGSSVYKSFDDDDDGDSPASFFTCSDETVFEFRDSSSSSRRTVGGVRRDSRLMSLGDDPSPGPPGTTPCSPLLHQQNIHHREDDPNPLRHVFQREDDPNPQRHHREDDPNPLRHVFQREDDPNPQRHHREDDPNRQRHAYHCEDAADRNPLAQFVDDDCFYDDDADLPAESYLDDDDGSSDDESEEEESGMNSSGSSTRRLILSQMALMKLTFDGSNDNGAPRVSEDEEEEGKEEVLGQVESDKEETRKLIQKD